MRWKMGFSAAKILPCPPYMPLGTIEIREGFGPLELSKGFSTVCAVPAFLPEPLFIYRLRLRVYNKSILEMRGNHMKRVITYGTFDLLHYGHINLLRRARALGDYLVVALSTDEFNWNEKHKKCYFTYEQRKNMLEAIRYVDRVIPEENWAQKRTDVHDYDVDVFVMGDDWAGKFDFLKEEGVEVVYLPRTPEISSTQIKQDLHK